jgi:competence protein ComEC
MGRTYFILGVMIAFAQATWAGPLQITFIDVGEGEAIYLEKDDKSILIDTGNVITAERIVKFLLDKNVNTLDMLIITHPHEDHMSGVFQVLQNIQALALYDNGETIPSRGGQNLYRWYKEFFRTGSYKALKKGDQLIWGDVRLDILNSVGSSSNWNKNSLVLKLHYKNTSFLLMADAGIDVEESLIQDQVDLTADVLKVGHHGAKDGTSVEFLEAVSPKYAVISINTNNIRGYPAPSTMTKLRQQNIEVLTTYAEGNIALESDGANVYRP